MITVLAYHNVEGHARLLLRALQAEGWADLLDIRLVTLSDVGLSVTGSDREVWHRAQELGTVLLTDNRNGTGSDSLEQTIVDSLTSTSLPVLTFGDGKRFFMDRQYRTAAIERVVEFLTYLEESRGISRLYVPQPRSTSAAYRSRRFRTCLSHLTLAYWRSDNNWHTQELEWHGMAKVFILYRRTDSAPYTGRMYDRLVAKFGRRNVFKDADDRRTQPHRVPTRW